MDEKALLEHAKGKVSKLSAFFENEIRARTEKQEKWNIRLKAIPKTGRFKGKTPTKISGKVAALLNICESKDAQISAIFKKVSGKGNRHNLQLGGAAQHAEFGQISPISSGITVQKPHIVGSQQASDLQGVDGVPVEFGVNTSPQMKRGAVAGKKSKSIFGKDALLQYTSTSTSPKVQRGKMIHGQEEDDEVRVVDINAWNELQSGEIRDFTVAHLNLLADLLQPSMAKYSAVMMFDFDAQNETELEIACDSIVQVYEESEDGWALVKHADKIGWVPLSYLRIVPKLDATISVFNEFGETIFFNALNPNMEIRQLVLRFVGESDLFSEARITKDIEVFVEDIDLLLKNGRTISGTLSALLHLDDFRTKVDDFDELALRLGELRNSWDATIREIVQTLEDKKMVLFAEPENIKITRRLADNIITESAAGDRACIYLQKIIDEGLQFEDTDFVTGQISELHSDYRAEQDQIAQDIKKKIMLEMQKPEIKIFSSGFIDLDMNSLEQMIARKCTAEEIISYMHKFSAENKKFESFGFLMGEIFGLKFGKSPPSIVTREYVLNSRKGARFRTIQEADSLNPQQKVDLIMKLIAKPECLIFLESKGNLRISVEEFQNLLEANEHLVTILADILFMNALGKRFTSFGQIFQFQKNLEILSLKQSILSFLKSWDKLKDKNISMEHIEFVFAQCEFFEHPLRLLNFSHLHSKAPFADYKELAKAMISSVSEFAERKKTNREKLVLFLSKNALFTTAVAITYALLDALLESAGDDADNAIRIMQELRQEKKRFSAFPALVAAVKERMTS